MRGGWGEGERRKRKGRLDRERKRQPTYRKRALIATGRTALNKQKGEKCVPREPVSCRNRPVSIGYAASVKLL